MPGAGAWLPGLRAARVGMPTTSEARSTSAPPELPGLIGALVWIASGSVAPPGPSLTTRPRALTMPEVTLPSRPSGLPMARTVAPGSSFDESPNFAGWRPAPFTRMTARSSGGNEPTRVPSSCLPDDVVTTKLVADPMTCALVTMLPLVSYTSPEPRPSAVWMSTTDGLTVFTTETVVLSAEPFADPLAVEPLPLVP